MKQDTEKIIIENGFAQIKSKKCVNSNWTASFLAGDNEEYCQCSVGECKVRVDVARNGHDPYTYILTEKELNSLKK